MNSDATYMETRLGRLLTTNKLAQAGELIIVFLVPFAIVLMIAARVEESLLARHAVVSGAILLALFLVWIGLRLRGQTWSHLGLTFRRPGGRQVVRAILQSVVILVAAVAAFVVGAVVMAMIIGRPEAADMSSYSFLKGNLPMLFLMLGSAYVTASFGEEVIYRGFLIVRMAELGGGGKSAWGLAVVLSALVFGLAHIHWGPAGMVQTGFMGLALGVSYLVVKRNLWVTILTHGYMDTILILQLYLAASGGGPD